MDATALCSLIDHTLLRPEATSSEVHAVAAQGRQLRTASVCVNPARVAAVAAALAGSDVLTCAVVAFPFGIGAVSAALEEASYVLGAGADEIDVVAPLHRIADRDWAGLHADLDSFRTGVPSGTTVKVILETAAWDHAQVDEAARVAVDAGADFLKTSTGFHPAGGATVQAVQLLAAAAGGIGVKASGGIRTWAVAEAMLAAGATRLGCSATEAIVAELASTGS